MRRMLIILFVLSFALGAATAFAGDLSASSPRPNAELLIKQVPKRTSVASRAVRSQVRGSSRSWQEIRSIPSPIRRKPLATKVIR